MLHLQETECLTDGLFLKLARHFILSIIRQIERIEASSTLNDDASWCGWFEQ
jgi:hypothetical protein